MKLSDIEIHYEDGEYLSADQRAEFEDVDDILERWLNGEDVSDFEDDGAEALTKEELNGKLG